jgi:hypothetical protein
MIDGPTVPTKMKARRLSADGKTNISLSVILTHVL